jgi:pyrimidine-specific ribonucleoside hydrolase
VTHKALVEADRFRELGRAGRVVAEWLDFYSLFHRETYGFAGSPIHDAVAVAHVIWPDLLETVERNVAVDTESELCRGRTVVDLWRRTRTEPNARVAVDIDAGAFVEFLVGRIASLG